VVTSFRVIGYWLSVIGYRGKKGGGGAAVRAKGEGGMKSEEPKGNSGLSHRTARRSVPPLVFVMFMPVVVAMVVREVEGVGGVVGDVVVDVAEGRAGVFGGEAAVFVFGEDLGLAVGEGGDLHADAAMGGFNRFDAAGEGIALHGAIADAEGGALVEEEVLELGGVGGFGKDLEEDAGAALFHLGGEEGDVEGPGGEELPGEVGGEFGGFVVDVGFEHREGLGDDALGAHGIAEENAEDVGDGEVAAAGPVSEIGEGHGRDGAEAVGDLGEDGGPGGGDEFGVDVAAADGAAFHKGEGGGGGEGDLAVGAADESAPDGKGGADDLFDAEGFESGEGAADIDDGIHPADLVKVNLIDGGVVDGGLRFADAGEDADGGLFDVVGEVAVCDDLADVGEMAFGGVVVDVDIDLGGGEAILHDLADVEVEVLDVELGEFGFEGGGGEAGIDEGPEHHVAAGSGDAVKVGGFHEEDFSTTDFTDLH